MPMYRTKAVEVDAFRWTGGQDQTEDPEWIVEAFRNGDAHTYPAFGSSCAQIHFEKADAWQTRAMDSERRAVHTPVGFGTGGAR